MDTNEQPAPRRFAFDYLDKVCFAGASPEHGTTSSPVWQLVVRGGFDESVARRAVQALALRYPLIASRAVSLDRNKTPDEANNLAYEIDPSPDVDRLFRVENLEGQGTDALASLQQRIFNDAIDLSRRYPLEITWARTAHDAGVLFFHQQHAVADGKAFFGMLEDFCALYDRAQAGDALDDVTPVGKVPEAQVAQPDRVRRILGTFLGFVEHLWALVCALVWRADLLVSNRSRDFTGDNHAEHLALPDTVVDAVRARRAETGYSLNDVVCSAIALSLARWSAAEGAPVRRFNVLVPADMRARGWQGRSFANHLSSYLVRFDTRVQRDAAGYLKAVHDQVRAQARRDAPRRKVLAEIAGSRLFPVPAIRRAVFDAKAPLLNFPFSNLIPISPATPDGRLATRSWVGDHLLIMTPCVYMQGANTTVIRYAGKLSFNFNYKASAVPVDAVRRFMDTFRTALADTLRAAGVDDQLTDGVEHPSVVRALLPAAPLPALRKSA